jgi:hypothetical protein
MKLFRWLCKFKMHAWRNDQASVAKRYRHNTWRNKTKNHLGNPRALSQTCKRCGRHRVWSFNRGTWRVADRLGGEARDNSAAYELDPILAAAAVSHKNVQTDSGSASNETSNSLANSTATNAVTIS